MSRALVKRSLLQKQRQQFMKRQREMLKHFANPSSFFNHQSLFIDEFFNDDEFLTPRGVFKTDPFFSRMKRAFDGEPEDEREVKRPKAKIMSQQPDEEKQEDDVEMKTSTKGGMAAVLGKGAANIEPMTENVYVANRNAPRGKRYSEGKQA